MALVSFRWRRILRSSIATVLGCGAIGAVGTMGLSALLNWDPTGAPGTPGGAGTWNYTTTTAWDDTGSLPNLPWSDVTGVDTGVFKGTPGLVTLGAPITANGLRFEVTGYTITDNGVAANTLTLVTAAVGGPAPIVANNAANVSTIISASLGGNDGIRFTAGAFTGATTTLNGDNKIIGGIAIDSGTVTLGLNNPGALNQSVRNTLTFGTLASSLRLNGNNTFIRDLTGTTNTSSIVNGRGATNAVLTVYQSNDQVVKTVLSDAAGTLELVKAGPATLTLGSNSTYTGATTVRGATTASGQQGTLELAGNNVGGLTATGAINLMDGGTLRLTNGLGANNGARLPDATPINMRGGTFAFSNDASAASFAEVAGAVNVLTGSNNIVADQAAVGQTSTITFGSLVRSVGTQGSTIDFSSRFQGSPIPAQTGIDNRDRIVFTSAPVLNGGIIGGWATFDGNEFATYNTAPVTSVKMAVYAADLVESSWTTETNVKVNVGGTIQLSDPTFTGIRTVNSLNIATEPVTLDLAGLTLNVDTGGIISQASGEFGGSIDNGVLTAGVAALTDLVLTVPNSLGTLTINANIVDNGVGQVNSIGLVKNGLGTVRLTNVNPYTGSTAAIGGTLEVSADNQLGGGSAAVTLKLYNGTLGILNTMTLNARRSLEVGGNSFVTIPAGSSVATAKTFSIGGPVTSLANSEGSLSFLSNAGEDSTTAEPGKVTTGILTPTLNIGGSLRIDATTATGTSTGIFRLSASAPSSIGHSFQLGMNGTAVFFQTGSTLSIGSGLDETLDVGVKDLATFSSVAKVGTMTLVQGANAVSQFTAKVDQVRIGVQTQASETVNNNTAGTVTLGVNSDITAGTSITISDNANGSGTTLTASTLTLGTGTNNITTQSMLIGGRKGTATVTLPASATGSLNLRGFGERTLNLSIARNDDFNSAGLTTGTLNAGNAGTVFTGSFDAIVIAQRTGSTLLGGATGTLTLNTAAGNSVVANSLTLGVDQNYNGTANATATAVGTLNMGGGSFAVYNDVVLGTQANNGTARGILNLTGGTFSVGGNITKTNNDRSMASITVDGGATLNLRNALANDQTSGSITASQLIYRSGSINFVATTTLDGRRVTSGSAFDQFPDALIIRDVSLPGTLAFTMPLSSTNNAVRYEAAGGGTGGTLASVTLGTLPRNFLVENSAAAAADLTITGAITGTGMLNKKGAGTLLLNGSVAGPVTVVAGELGGTGTLAGTVDVALDTVGATGGTLVPGGSGIGTLATGALTFATTTAGLNTTLKLEINFATRTADKVNVTGALALAADNSTVLSVTDLDLNAPFSFFALPIVSYSSRNSGLFFAGGQAIDDYDPDNNPESATFTLNSGKRFRIDYNYNNTNTIALIAVPEPSSLGLLAVGMALLGLRRRRSCAQ